MSKKDKMRQVVKPQEFTHPELTKAIADLCDDNGPETQEALAQIIRQMISKESQILYTARQTDDGASACTVEIDGTVFLTAFTEGKYVATAPGVMVLVAPINKLLESVCASDGPRGIVFNAFNKECHCGLTRDLIGKIIRAEI